MRTFISIPLAGALLCACGEPAAVGDEEEAGATSGAATSSGVGGSATNATTGAGSAVAGAGGGASAGAGGGSPVCPIQALSPGEHAGSLMFDGKARDYEVTIPTSYDNASAVPLVLDLHGLGSTAHQQQLISGWAAVAEAEGFVVVRPSGYGLAPSWNGGDTCCGQALGEDLDDVGLMRAIVADVRARACIDPKRIYASGLSNGAAMTHRLGCDAADLFAAIAPVSYPIAYLPLGKCQPSRPIAVMHSHGTLDTTVPYGGSFGIASAQDSFAFWGELDGCNGTPTETYGKGSSHCDTRGGCDAGVEVTLCTITGPHLLYGNVDDVPIASLAWEFFVAHPMP